VAELDEMRATLSPDEVTRANRFHFARDRDAFVSARATLRRILAAYLGVRPLDVRFAYAVSGKPSLASPVRGIEFNLSHSGDLLLLALSRGVPLGVDVEHRRPTAWEDLAPVVFTDSEMRDLWSLPQPQQYDGFLNGWTRKEAYVKARGDGLTLPLDSFSVTLKPGDAAALTWTRAGTAETCRWSVHHVTLDARHVGAVVTMRPAAAPVLLEWSPQNPSG
jgi:4'-phosphopantetheinyl transferase